MAKAVSEPEVVQHFDANGSRRLAEPRSNSPT